MKRLAKLALRAYPPSFRARYGGELSALVDELDDSPRTTADLFGGAAKAWIRPRFTGADARRRRLQASISATWIAWCAGFLIVPSLGKALLDPAGPNTAGAVRVLLYVGTSLLLLGLGVAAIGLALVVVRVLAPAPRVKPAAALRPLVPALALGVIVVAGLLTLVLTTRANGGQQSAPSWGVAAWAISVVALLGCAGIGPVVSLSRLDASARELRAPAALSVVLAIVLAGMSACGLVAVLLAGDAALFSSIVPVILALLVACGASVIALVSSTRGIRAVQHA